MPQSYSILPRVGWNAKIVDMSMMHHLRNDQAATKLLADWIEDAQKRSLLPSLLKSSMLIVLDNPKGFYCSVTTKDGYVTQYAPIVHYMYMWGAWKVINYAKRMKWRTHILPLDD